MESNSGKKKLLVRIIVPALIAVALIIIWVLKTQNGSSDNSQSIQPMPEFALETKSIDVDALKEYKLPIIIDFGSDSCMPCKRMAPALKTINEQMQNKAIIKYIDVWENSDAVKDFPIQVIPTQIFINADGTPYMPSDEININFDVYSLKETGEHVFTVHQGGLTVEEMQSILYDMGVAK